MTSHKPHQNGFFNGTLACLILAAAMTTLAACGVGPSIDDDAVATEDGTTGSDVITSDEWTGDSANRPDNAATDDGNGEDATTVTDNVQPEDEGHAQDIVGQDTAGTDTAVGDTAGDDAAGEDTAVDDVDVVSIGCQEEPTTPVIMVNVYNDANSSSKTDLAQSRTVVDTPVAGIPVSLVAPAEGSGETCDQGWYYFGPDDGETFTDGVRMLKVDVPVECRVTSHNMARRTPVALTEGSWKMLVMGDSIPKQGTTTGTFFFDNVAAYLDGFGDITVKNVAQSGSTTSGWMPDLASGLFNVRAVPEIPDSDVVFISLGGNDIMHYVANNYTTQTVDQLMEGITNTITTVEDNLATIFAEIRTQNPDADIVWLIYPNYADSDEWRQVTGSYASLVKSYFDEQMYGIIKWAAGIDGLLLVDLFDRMSKEELDDSLFDELHYNAYGHQILGDELLKVLNGVNISDGAPTIGGDRFIGINCDK